MSEAVVLVLSVSLDLILGSRDGSGLDFSEAILLSYCLDLLDIVVCGWSDILLVVCSWSKILPVVVFGNSDNLLLVDWENSDILLVVCGRSVILIMGGGGGAPSD